MTKKSLVQQMMESNDANSVKEMLSIFDAELDSIGQFLKEIQNGNPKRELIHKVVESLKESQINLRDIIKELP